MLVGCVLIVDAIMVYICPTCNKEFATKYTMERHAASVHTSLTRDHSCSDEESDMSSDEAQPRLPQSQSEAAANESESTDDEDNSPDSATLEESKYP